MKRPQTLDNVSTKLQRIAELARKAPTMAIRTLAHHIDVEFLRVAYQQTRKDGAVGVDEQTAADYAALDKPAERSVAMQRRDTMQALMAHGEEWIDRQNEMLRDAERARLAARINRRERKSSDRRIDLRLRALRPLIAFRQAV